MTEPPPGPRPEEATPHDLEALWPQVTALHAHEGLPAPGDAVRSALRRLLGDERHGKAFVVRDGAGVAAYLVLTAGYSLEYGGETLLVDELFVRDRERGRGLGSALLDAAEAYAKARGVGALLIEVGTGNPQAHRLYGRRGFVQHDRHLMAKRLGLAAGRRPRA